MTNNPAAGGVKSRLAHQARIAKYHLRLLYKKQKARLLHTSGPLPRENQPSVTLFISNMNTRYALELALESAQRWTGYENYRIVIADNASTDGSREYLQNLDSDKIRVILSDEPRQHAQWLDQMFHEADTDYWFAVDSDMLFLGADWLSDLVRTIEADPGAYFVSGEPKMGSLNQIEPFGKQRVDAGECPCTWLFGVRTALREHVDTSFAYCHDGTNPATGNLMTYDTGGKLLRDAYAKGLRHVIMPQWFQLKWYHFGSLSWSSGDYMDPSYMAFKAFQKQDIERRAVRKKF
jgi:glycosyltransferase involved in cell wall biosynthesis